MVFSTAMRADIVIHRNFWYRYHCEHVCVVFLLSIGVRYGQAKWIKVCGSGASATTVRSLCGVPKPQRLRRLGLHGLENHSGPYSGPKE